MRISVKELRRFGLRTRGLGPDGRDDSGRVEDPAGLGGRVESSVWIGFNGEENGRKWLRKC